MLHTVSNRKIIILCHNIKEILVKSGAKLVRHPFFPFVTTLVPVLSFDVNVLISNVGCFWQERPYCSYGSLALE